MACETLITIFVTIKKTKYASMFNCGIEKETKTINANFNECLKRLSIYFVV